MSKFVSGSVWFEVDQKEPSRVYNRYRIGNIIKGDLLLDRFELSFLLLNAKSVFSKSPSADRLNNLATLMSEEGDIERLVVFSNLKSKGLVCKIEKDILKLKHKDEPSWIRYLTIRNENGFFNPGESGDHEAFYAIVDSDGDTTYYQVSKIDLLGRSDYKLDKPVVKFDFLDLMTAENADYGRKRKIGHEIVIAPEQENADHYGGNSDISTLKKRVRSDLVSRNMIVRTGFKYGADFRLYSESIEGHADYLLIVSEKDSLRWYDISRAARIASSVHKEFIIATALDDRIEYFSILRMKDILAQI